MSARPAPFLKTVCAAAMVLLVTVSVTGCGSSSDNMAVSLTTESSGARQEPTGQQPAGPSTSEPLAELNKYRETVSEIVAFNDRIREGFAEKDRWAVRCTLHKMGKALREMGEVAATDDLSGEERDRAQEAVSQLYTVFGEIDASMLATNDASYADASPCIERNLEILVEVCAVR